MPQKDFLPSKTLILIHLYQQETADKAEWVFLVVSGKTSVHN